MTANKRKKVVKYRGTTYHGAGHRKKRRGAGSRGGRGRAGSGKRGKAKKQSWGKLGKKGFSGRKKKIKTINISALNGMGKEEIDLTSLGYDKLLGTGKLNVKVNVKVNQFSRKAEEKIKAAGGAIVSAGKKEVAEE